MQPYTRKREFSWRWRHSGDRRTSSPQKPWSVTASLALVFLFCTAQVQSRDTSTACAVELIEEARHANLVAPYEQREGGYCDGQAPELHAGYLELQSLTVGRMHFNGNRVVVSVAAPGDYWLRGRDLDSGGMYRLDGALSKGRLTIGGDSAIWTLNLTPDRVGLYALRRVDGKDVYAPVSTGRPGTITAIFKNPGRIAEISSATLCKDSQPDCATTVPTCLHHHVNGTALVTLFLPSVPISGRYRLTVSAKRTRPGRAFGLIFLDL